MLIDKKIIRWLGMLVFLFILAISCESDNLESGYELLGNPATGNKTWINLVAYNLYNQDSIRSDDNVLTEGVLGIYNENVFGTTKAEYVSQIRLSVNNPTFSDSIKTIDSVAFILTPNLSDTISTEKFYTHLNSTTKYDNNTTDDIDTFRIVTKYKIDKKYPKSPTITTFPLQVSTIANYLYSTTEPIPNRSLTNVPTSILLNAGGTDFMVNEYVYKTEFKNTSGTAVTQIYKYNGTVRSTIDVTNIPAAIRIPLDKSYFQTQILDKEGSNDLSDNARFTRYINGIKLSIPSSVTDGFLFNFTPSNVNIRLYYNYIKKKTGGTISTGNSTFDLSLASIDNVRMNLYTHTRNGIYQAGTSTNTIGGNDKLYLQGMGGPRIALLLDAKKLAEIKDSIKTKGWNIIDAKLRFHEDTSLSDLDNPTNIHGYLYNDTSLPTIQDFKKHTIFPDILDFRNLGGYSQNPTYNTSTDPKYYDFKITSTLKNIVEKDSINKPIIIEMGNYEYITNTNSPYFGLPLIYNYNTFTLANQSQNTYSPYRMVFYGNTEADLTKKLRLEVIYTKQ